MTIFGLCFILYFFKLFSGCGFRTTNKSKEIEFPACEWKLADEFENGYEAIANKEAIKQIGKLFLATIGDWKNEEPMVRSEQLVDRERSAASSRTSSWFYDFIDIVDTIMEWLEHSGKDMMPSLKKYKTVLRGVFHITGNVHSYIHTTTYTHTLPLSLTCTHTLRWVHVN